MQQQTEEQNISQTNVNELLNSHSSETIYKREQYEESPIWLITTEKGTIGVIGEHKIGEWNDIKEATEHLEKPSWKLICTIIAVLADRVYILNEEHKKTK